MVQNIEYLELTIQEISLLNRSLIDIINGYGFGEDPDEVIIYFQNKVNSLLKKQWTGCYDKNGDMIYDRDCLLDEYGYMYFVESDEYGFYLVHLQDHAWGDGYATEECYLPLYPDCKELVVNKEKRKSDETKDL